MAMVMLQQRPRLLVFASGTKDGGGSGFQWLIDGTKAGILQADIVGVVSNYEHGGVRRIADREEVPFFHFSGPWTAERYQSYIEETEADLVALSGWLKLVEGLDPAHTINNHPGPLPEYGGDGMYGHHVHEAVVRNFGRGLISCSAVSMHFVTEKFDEGPLFFEFPVAIREGDTADDLGRRVNECEHVWQAWVTNLVVTGQIRLEDGKVIVPDWYEEQVFCPDHLRR